MNQTHFLQIARAFRGRRQPSNALRPVTGCVTLAGRAEAAQGGAHV